MKYHSLLPWRVNPGHPTIWTQDGICIAVTKKKPNEPATLEDRANARLIVTAVNNHEKLIDALRHFAKQKIGEEFGPEEYESADFEGGYTSLVEEARAVLAEIEKEEK